MRLYRTIRCTFNASPASQLLCGMCYADQTLFLPPHPPFYGTQCPLLFDRLRNFPTKPVHHPKDIEALRSIMLFVPSRDRKLTASSHSSIPCRSPTLRTRTVSQPSAIPKPSLASRPTAKLSRGSSTGLLGPRLKSERLMASREGL